MVGSTPVDVNNVSCSCDLRILCSRLTLFSFVLLCPNVLRHTCGHMHIDLLCEYLASTYTCAFTCAYTCAYLYTYTCTYP